MSRRESLLRGAAALAIAGLLIKVSNLLVRVPLSRLLEAEGLGIYQMALPAFFALFHIAAGGVPVAVQNLVAEYTSRGRQVVADQVLRLALAFTTIVGTGAAAVLLLGAPLLARMLGEPLARWPLLAVAPAVPLFAMDAVYRNYLQGRNLMTPSATGSILEQGTKVVVTLLAACWLLPLGKAQAAAGAAMGITVGALISVFYMAFICRRIRSEDPRQKDPGEPKRHLVRRIAVLAWPVTLGSVTMPLLSLLDVGIIQNGFLKAGYAQSAATAIYGAYSGIAVQVVWFPWVLTNALANALFPVLSAAAARKEHDRLRERVILGLRATALICLPVAVGVAVLSRHIAILFGDANAAIPLLYMAPVALLGPLTWLMVVQLQALGKTIAPMRNLTFTLVLKLGLDALLAPIPGIDVKGVALASVVMFSASAFLNARALERELRQPIPWTVVLSGPLAASAVMGLVLMGLAVLGWLPRLGWSALLVTAAIAPFLYIFTLLATKAITPAEIGAMAGPLGSRLERLTQMLWPWS